MSRNKFTAQDTQDFLRYMEDLGIESRKGAPDPALLVEDLEVNQIPDDLMQAASLDDQIDEFFMDAEKDANTEADEDDEVGHGGEPKMGEAITSYSGAAYLFEAPPGEDDPMAVGGPEGEEEAPQDEPAEPEEEPLPPFDPNVFARQIARLVDNYENLLDIPSVIVNRAIKYLLDNYDEETVEEVKEILAQNFDIDMSPEGQREVEPEPHYAVGALGGGTGQGGGVVGDVGGGGGDGAGV